MATQADKDINISLYQNLIVGITTAIDVNEGIVKLVGSAQVGKTSLCRTLAVELEKSGHTVLSFLTPPESSETMQKAILSNLSLPSDKNFTRTLTQYLTQQVSSSEKSGSHLVIIFDEAEKISDEVFLSIRLLSNIQDNAQALIRLVICGDYELDEKLSTIEYRSLAQYLSQSFTVPAMNKAELEEFCGVYATLSGTQSIDQARLKKIYKQSRGYPGKALALLNNKEILPSSDNNKTWAKNVFFRIKLGLLALVLLISLPAIYLLFDLGSDEIDTETGTESAIKNTSILVAENMNKVEVLESEIEESSLSVIAPPITALPVIAVPETTLPEKVAPKMAAAVSDAEVPEAVLTELFFNELTSSWLNAWQDQNIEEYFAYYDVKFRPSYFVSQALWRVNRHDRILNADNIRIRFDRFVITKAFDESVTTRFWMRYETGEYGDETLKEVRWKLTDEGWKIDLERNREVIRLK